MNSRKQETSGGDTNNSKILSRTTTTTTTTTTIPSSSSSRQSSSWAAGFKNPRIVRVSRTFGGKDRHSKVCTVKGLRDRRIRLSVPTAIQLYDLQDRLGLSQPSKVVDWLIDATKNEIDKLPPLQMPPPSLSHFFNMKDHQDIADATLRSETGFPTNGPFGNYHSFSSSQNQCQQHNMSFPSGSHHQQLYFCPSSSTSATTLPSLVPPYNSSQLNHFHPTSLVPTLQLISTPVKSSFSLNDNNKGLNLQDHHKEGTGS